jgi:hypothetical protein
MVAPCPMSDTISRNPSNPSNGRGEEVTLYQHKQPPYLPSKQAVAGSNPAPRPLETRITTRISRTSQGGFRPFHWTVSQSVSQFPEKGAK